MRALITGANGFIARALIARLQSDEWQVRGTVRSENQVACPPKGVEEILIREIGTETDWSETMIGVDTVVHLAARVHVMQGTSTDHLAAFRCVNVAGTERLARMAATAGVRRLVFMSSVKVNGKGMPEPYTENDLPAPEDPYGVSKWEAEEVLRKVATETDMEVVIIRPPLVYGPGVKANFLRLLETVYQGVPLPLRSISNSRSLIYLGNLIDAIATCMVHPKAAGQTYLVSDGEDVSTPELIQRVATAMDKPAWLFPFPPSLMRLAGMITGKSAGFNRLVGSLTVDNSSIRRDLDWQPPYKMEHGLKETAEWFMYKVRNEERG